MAAPEPEGWVTLAKVAAAALTVIATAIAGLIAGRKQSAEGARAVDGEVVAATFTERALMERLISALNAAVAAMNETTEATERVAVLLEAEAQRRHDEAVVRAALKERGILP